MLHKLSQLIFGTNNVQSSLGSLSGQHMLKHNVRKSYIWREAVVGARVLGPIPSGHDREFFCLDRDTWVWHETWRDEKGHKQEFTVQYEVDPSGVLKRVNGGQYTKLQGVELARFEKAVYAYYQEVSRHVYGVTPQPIS